MSAFTTAAAQGLAVFGSAIAALTVCRWLWPRRRRGDVAVVLSSTALVATTVTFDGMQEAAVVAAGLLIAVTTIAAAGGGAAGLALLVFAAAAATGLADASVAVAACAALAGAALVASRTSSAVAAFGAAASVLATVAGIGSIRAASLVALGALLLSLHARSTLGSAAAMGGPAIEEEPEVAQDSLGEPGDDLFRALIADASDMVTLIDPSGLIEYQNDAAIRWLSPDGRAQVGKPIEAVVHPDDRAVLLGLLDPARLLETRGVAIELRLRVPNGSYVRTETTVNNHVANNAVRALALTSRDISDRKMLEEQLVVRAFHDSLTGLGNRALFRDRLEHAVAWARRYGTGIAVLFIDLDGFKLVNDTLGHDVGDGLLQEVAKRLASNLRTTDTVARMGGDEFAILLEDPRDVSAAATIAARILASLQTPIFVDPFPLKVSCSIGLDTTGGKHAVSAEDLLRNADLAMYRAKALGKNQVARYEPNMREEAQLRMRLEKELRLAIDRDELVLHYQPVGSIASGEITGVEALVRWQHPERGMIPPSDFVPVAEESGLIVELGRWALAKACTEMAEVSQRTGREFWVSVNVATRQLLQPGLVQSVRGALNRSGLPAQRLVLEITEGALLDDPKACASLLHQLRGLGVRLAIDDFGTGYSSLSRLRSFAVDKLKIDRSFIQEIVNASDHAPIVAAVMAMAHSLGLTAVAEGVETADQLACLHRHGCEEVQGYLLARPLPVNDLEVMLRREGDLLASVGVPARAAVAESPLSALVREAASLRDRTGTPRADVVPLLLTELSRQLHASSAYLAKVDLVRGGEEVVVASRGGAVDLPSHLLIASDNPGTFRTVVGNDVPSVLRERGVASLTVVPMVDDGPLASYVLAVVGTTPSAPPPQHVVLMELLTRLLGDTSVIESSPSVVGAVA